MKITTISVAYDRKFNLGNYNSLRLEASLLADVDEDESPDFCLRLLQDRVREAVRSEYSRLEESIKSNESVRVKSQIS